MSLSDIALLLKSSVPRHVDRQSAFDARSTWQCNPLPHCSAWSEGLSLLAWMLTAVQ